MTLQTTGPISLSNIRDEFDGGAGAISMANYYRGGVFVPAGAVAGIGSSRTAPLTATSPFQIPTSGSIQFSMFYGTSNYTVYIFNTSQTWVVPTNVTSVEMILVGGGGGGGGTRTSSGDGAGGGGAGGVQYRRALAVTPGASLPIVIGAGGAGGNNGRGATGGNSTFAGLTALGGGGGGGGDAAGRVGGDGGSGGGGCGLGGGPSFGPGFPILSGGVQLGFEGGAGTVLQDGGGGGGYSGRGQPSVSAAGGIGLSRALLAPGTTVSLAGGGGGGASGGSNDPGIGVNGGGNGGNGEGFGTVSGVNGTVNTGGGGGGSGARIGAAASGGNGGSGVLILVHQQTFPTGAMQSASGAVSISDSHAGGAGSAFAQITFGSNRLNTSTGGGNLATAWPQWRSTSVPEDSDDRYFITVTVTSGGVRNVQNNTLLLGGQSVSYSLRSNVSFSVSANVPPGGFDSQSGTFTVEISEYIGGPALATGTVTLLAEAEF